MNDFKDDVVSNSITLDDLTDWNEFKQHSHQLLDEVIDNLITIRDKPLWQPQTTDIINQFQSSANTIKNPMNINQLHQEFNSNIFPYGSGNLHPGFMGWVQGGGNAAGLLGEIASAGMNMNCGGRSHVGIQIEKQIISWVREWFQFPITSEGIFVTGTSFANFISVLVAKCSIYGHMKSRTEGNYQFENRRPIIFTSEKSHRCIVQAIEMVGLGSNNLYKIPVDPVTHQISIDLLKESIESLDPLTQQAIMIIGTAGTVDIGAIDDLTILSQIAKQYNLWFHVDGAFGALGVLSSYVSPLLKGIELADSIAFDFHKWMNVQYDAGFILIRNGDYLRDTFSSPAAYLNHESSGLASGDWWPCDYGPDLSRGCRAMKVYFTIKLYGTDALGTIITKSCQLAKLLGDRIISQSNIGVSGSLELVTPIALNIACFRYIVSDNSLNDEINRQIVIRLHHQGLVAPSLTTIQRDGKSILVIRAAFINHRTTEEDIDNLLSNVIHFGDTIAQSHYK